MKVKLNAELTAASILAGELSLGSESIDITESMIDSTPKIGRHRSSAVSYISITIMRLATERHCKTLPVRSNGRLLVDAILRYKLYHQGKLMKQEDIGYAIVK